MDTKLYSKPSNRSAQMFSFKDVLYTCSANVEYGCQVNQKVKLEEYSVVLYLNTIATLEERDYQLVSLVDWYEAYKDFVNQKTINPERYWFIHKMVMRSFMVIRNALPDMSHYLHNPKDTQRLETFFGYMKGLLKVHRGLSHQLILAILSNLPLNLSMKAFCVSLTCWITRISISYALLRSYFLWSFTH